MSRPPVPVELLRKLDTGLLQTHLAQLIDYRKDHPVHELLSFAGASESKAKQLEGLLKQLAWSTQSEDVRRALTTFSVARFIFSSNEIEHLATQHQEDTHEIVRRYMAITAYENDEAATTAEPRPRNWQHVLRTLQLLQDTHQVTQLACGDPGKQLAFDRMKLCKWHRILLLGREEQPTAAAAQTDSADSSSAAAKPAGASDAAAAAPSAGVFSAEDAMHAGRIREFGAQTLDSSHVYPHHSVLAHNVNALGFLNHQLWQWLAAQPLDGHRRLLHTFALAAFVQFHFVDVHPFEDGNGRMCRFLSKRTLDWVLPVPVPMFADRARYMRALIDARKNFADNPRYLPSLLVELLLDAAIAHYTQLLQMVQNTAYAAVLSVQTVAEIDELPDVSAEAKEALRAALPKIEEGAAMDVQVGASTYRLYRFPELLFDDI